MGQQRASTTEENRGGPGKSERTHWVQARAARRPNIREFLGWGPSDVCARWCCRGFENFPHCKLEWHTATWVAALDPKGTQDCTGPGRRDQIHDCFIWYRAWTSQYSWTCWEFWEQQPSCGAEDHHLLIFKLRWVLFVNWSGLMSSLTFLWVYFPNHSCTIVFILVLALIHVHCKCTGPRPKYSHDTKTYNDSWACLFDWLCVTLLKSGDKVIEKTSFVNWGDAALQPSGVHCQVVLVQSIVCMSHWKWNACSLNGRDNLQ